MWKNLSILAGSFNIPLKKGTLGKEAHLVNTNDQVIAVADGFFGGWEPDAIKSGNYARLLMKHVSDLVGEFHPSTTVGLKAILNEAYFRMNVKGIFSACILSFSGNNLQAINLGQGGFRVMRHGIGILHKSAVQQRNFNTRLHQSKAEKPRKKADLMEIPVQCGDVVILATDGLFDNVFDQEIEEVVEGCQEKGYDPKAMAKALAEVAYRNSNCRTKTSPFEVAAYKAGYEREHGGGKPDDVTVVAAYICA